MAALLWFPVLFPALLGGLAAWRHGSRYIRLVPLVASLVVLATGVALVVRPQVVVSSVLRADALTSYVLVCVGAVGVVALWGGLGPAPMDGRGDALVCAFLSAMSLAVLADNLGVVWVAIEATTIATAFLVGHSRTRGATEAAWKYVILASVGVALAFLGLVLLYAAGRAGGHPTLSWVSLTGGGIDLTPHLARVGIALAVLGFATKAGLAPMHSWLPDAHSQAPAPVSGLMSGVLLSVAMYAILRVQAVASTHGAAELVHGMLLTFGLLSLAVSAFLTVTQRDYKRLLAYSSIEHMGVIALGVGSGTQLGLAAALLHMLGHGVVKAAMFVVAGRLLRATGSTRIADVTGLLRRRRDLGGPFLAGAAALLGFPPFVTFFTEVAVLIALVASGGVWVAGAGAALLLVTFVGIAGQVLRMTTGSPQDPALGGAALAEDSSAARAVPVTLALASAAAIGFLPLVAAPVLLDAVAVLGGVR